MHTRLKETAERKTSKSYLDLAKTTYREWMEDKAPQLGASLAFYSMLSVAPLVLIAIAISAAVFGAEAAQGQIVSQLQGLLGVEGGRAIEDLIASARKPGEGVFAGAMGALTLFLGASGVFGQLQDALNVIWDVEPKSGQGVWGFIRNRFLSFGMVLAIGFLLLVSLILGAVVSALGSYAQGTLPALEPLMQLLNFALSFLVTTVLFGLIFKVLPDVKVPWRDIWLGAALTSALFTAGKVLIGIYLGKAAIASTYGAAGSLVVVLIWVYYSSQILFFGAEFTQVYAARNGHTIVPSETAKRRSIPA